MANQIVKFKTRLDKKGEPVTTTATVDWKGVTDEQLKELAIRSVIIAQQAIYRTSEVIPTEDTIEVAKVLSRERGGFKVTPENIVARVNKMTPEEKAFILNQLRGKA